MTKEIILKYLDVVIKWCFILLFFLVPLIFTPWNSELFEYNKMMLTYGLTTLIAGSFLIKSFLRGKLEVTKTPFDIPILLFLLSQILSTIFSIEVHTSIWGYYSRFHGGLLSTISYITLFYVFVSTYAKDKSSVLTVIKTGIISATLVTVYAILQRMGIDKHIWVQDVQNRVFSSLGQPNWLAAYFSIIIPASLALYLSNRKSDLKYLLLTATFFATIIFTRSRSGFVGLAGGIFIFLLTSKLLFTKKGIQIISLFAVLTFLLGSPFSQFNKFTLPAILNSQKAALPQTDITAEQAPIGQMIEYGGTESGIIRSIVWKGAIDVFKHNPWLGSGVETFAYSYYQFRPVEHNMTSEWDFLYNRAHNEYLNFASNSGLVGLSAYLLIIGFFIVFSIISIRKSEDKIMLSALLGAYVSILISNFWGFSVVIIAIYFFMIPAFSFILSINNNSDLRFRRISLIASYPGQITLIQKIISTILILTIAYIWFVLVQMWRADSAYNLGSQYSKANQYLASYQYLTKAVKLNPNEPVFAEQLAITESNLALIAYTEDQMQVYDQLRQHSIEITQRLTDDYPKNVNFAKTRTRVLFTLSEVDPSYLNDALISLNKAWELAPNDSKIVYNIGLLYARLGNNDQAIEFLKKSADLKPNYYEPHWALALFYEQLGENELAISELEFILKNIRPDDQSSIEKLKELQ